MKLSFSDYRKKVLGCWLGKAVGGTLGGPHEGQGGPLGLTFYDPVPDTMLPNDDLDLQVVWLEAIRRHGLPIDRRVLAQAWLEHVHLWPDEYGVACRNLEQGIYPPASGAFDNGFTAGMGSAIRSELWACLAPGDPDLAGALALQDACVDHAGEGLYAEVFLAALQSAAFVRSEPAELLDLALGMIPAESRVARAVQTTRDAWGRCGDWTQVRETILAEYGRRNFTDVAQNLAFTVLGWLAAPNDFGTAICTAVNCGKDTDCTGATLGALLGILDPDGIPQEWLRPIGRNLVLSPGMVGMHEVRTLDDLTDQVAALAANVLSYYGSGIRISGGASACSPRGPAAEPRHRSPEAVDLRLPVSERDALLTSDPIVMHLRYPEGIALVPGQTAPLQLRLSNPLGIPVTGHLDARAPDGWSCSLDATGIELRGDAEQLLDFTLLPPADIALRPCRNPLDFNLRLNGMRFTVSAGIPLALPWLHWKLDGFPDALPPFPKLAERRECAGHSQALAEDPAAYAIDVKLAATCDARWIVQVPRPLRAWIDGDKVLEHDGTHRVPAVHRAGPTGCDLRRARGWHQLVVVVDAGEPGHLFFGLGYGTTWDWLRDAEFRLPALT